MIFTGSREWGEERPGVKDFPPEWTRHELEIGAQSVVRLVERWVSGFTKFDGKKQTDAYIEVAPGLVVIQGGAPGLDTKVANAAQMLAFGLHRRSRGEWEKYGDIITPEDMSSRQLAEGLWLETYPADWENRPRNLAGPERNQRMLDQGVDHVIAFFAHGRTYGPGIRGGTNDMVRRAVAAGVTVDIYVANDRRWRKP